MGCGVCECVWERKRGEGISYDYDIMSRPFFQSSKKLTPPPPISLSPSPLSYLSISCSFDPLRLSFNFPLFCYPNFCSLFSPSLSFRLAGFIFQFFYPQFSIVQISTCPMSTLEGCHPNVNHTLLNLNVLTSLKIVFGYGWFWILFSYYVCENGKFIFYVRMKKDTFLKTTKVHYGFPGYMYNCIGTYLPTKVNTNWEFQCGWSKSSNLHTF